MKNATKRIMAMLLVLTMILGLVPSVFAAELPFTDVNENQWYAEYVAFVYENSYMLGTSTTEFEPEASCTRAMTATVLWRVDGECPVSGPASFTDLTEDWYANAVAWAERTGMVNGIGDGKFAPDRAVTREELVTMVWRLAGKPAAKGDVTAYPDHAAISEYAKTAFAWAIGKGIINGSDGKLLPQETATRAQFAKIIATYTEATKPCAEHKWDDGVVTTEPTCTEDGVKTYTCEKCDLTREESLPAIGHIFVDGACTNCGEKMAEEEELIILFTNDVHTYIDGALSYDTVADLKAQFGKVAGGVLLVDAGDHVQGTAYGSMDQGKTIVELMNAAGYDYAALGNHEFDYGMARALEIMEQADYEYLSTNFYHETNGVRGENVLNGTAIVEMGGKKVAIIGITTPETFTKTTPAYFMNEAGEYIYGIAGGEDGSALYADVQAAIDAVKDEADYVIALGHLGVDRSSQPWTSAEVIANVSGLDAFIDGHSHSTVGGEIIKDKEGNDVVLAQTGEYFAAIGCMTIKGDEITVELITEHTGSDATTKELKDAWMKEVDDKLGEVIGHAEVTFDNYDAEGKRLVRKQETNTGDFAADALYYLFNVTEGLKVDAAIMNGGGIRNKAVTGDISYLTCKNIHTFGNVACLITVTGQQILDALEWGARDAGSEKECGGFLHVSGINYEIHTYISSTVQADDKGVWVGGPTGEYRVKNVTIGGEALDLSKTYNLAGYNYTLRDLGDGFAMFDGAVNVKDYVMEDYMVLANYIKSFPVNETTGLPTITAENSVYGDVNGAGRITLVDTPNLPTYTLTTELQDGDQVIIVNAANNIALGGEYGTSFYNPGVAVAPADGKLATEDTTIVWTVGKDGDNYTFSYNGKKIGMGASYSSMPLGEVNDTWTISAAPTVADAFFIKNEGRQLYMEWFADKQYWSGYGNTSNEALFAHQFYVLRDVTPPTVCEHVWDEGTVTTEPTCTEEGVKTFTCGTCGETKTEAIAATGHNYVDNTCTVCGDVISATVYELTTELNDGDQVIIVNAANNIALGGEYGTSYYNPGVAVAPADGKLATEDTTIVWTVGKEGDFYTFSYNGQKIGLGESYSSMPLGAVNDTWTISAAPTVADAFFIKNEGRQLYMEWYADKQYWSAYSNTSNEALFAHQFYVLRDVTPPTDCNHTWDEGTVTTEPTCTETGVKTFTCSSCGETMTKSVPATGHSYAEGTCTNCGADDPNYNPNPNPDPSGFVVATELTVGDVIVWTATVGENTTEMASYNTGKNIIECSVITGEPTGAMTMTVAAGSEEGTFAFQLSDGKYLSWSASNKFTLVDAVDASASWIVTFNADGTVKILNASTASLAEAEQRVIFLNWNDGSPRFAPYAKYPDKINSAAQYALPVIYKQV